MTVTADSLRENQKDLEAAIFRIRQLHVVGKDAPKSAQRYLAFLRTCHERREAAAVAGLTGPLIADQMPIPFRDQIVGEPDKAEHFRKSWAGVGSSYPFTASQPVERRRAA